MSFQNLTCRSRTSPAVLRHLALPLLQRLSSMQTKLEAKYHDHHGHYQHRHNCSVEARSRVRCSGVSQMPLCRAEICLRQPSTTTQDLSGRKKALSDVRVKSQYTGTRGSVSSSTFIASPGLHNQVLWLEVCSAAVRTSYGEHKAHETPLEASS